MTLSLHFCYLLPFYIYFKRQSYCKSKKHEMKLQWWNNANQKTMCFCLKKKRTEKNLEVAFLTNDQTFQLFNKQGLIIPSLVTSNAQRNTQR